MAPPRSFARWRVWFTGSFIVTCVVLLRYTLHTPAASCDMKMVGKPSGIAYDSSVNGDDPGLSGANIFIASWRVNTSSDWAPDCPGDCNVENAAGYCAGPPQGPRRCECVPGVGSEGCDFTVRSVFGGHDPYEGVVARAPDVLEAHGWGPGPDVYHMLVTAVRPRLTVEVGVWKGRSAIYLAEAMKTLPRGSWWEANAPAVVQHASTAITTATQPAPYYLAHLGLTTGAAPAAGVLGHKQGMGILLAVDTWLGSMEMWRRCHGRNCPDPGPLVFKGQFDLHLKNGFPQVYQLFLNNVVYAGLADTIVPFPVPSGLAATYLTVKGFKADLIHIDAGHSYEDVAQDIAAWWPLLAKGGVLLGDDYTHIWPGVVRAVNEFASKTGLMLHTYSEHPKRLFAKWWVRRGVFCPAEAVGGKLAGMARKIVDVASPEEAQVISTLGERSCVDTDGTVHTYP